MQEVGCRAAKALQWEGLGHLRGVGRRWGGWSTARKAGAGTDQRAWLGGQSEAFSPMQGTTEGLGRLLAGINHNQKSVFQGLHVDSRPCTR